MQDKIKNVIRIIKKIAIQKLFVIKTKIFRSLIRLNLINIFSLLKSKHFLVYLPMAIFLRTISNASPNNIRHNNVMVFGDFYKHMTELRMMNVRNKNENRFSRTLFDVTFCFISVILSVIISIEYRIIKPLTQWNIGNNHFN